MRKYCLALGAMVVGMLAVQHSCLGHNVETGCEGAMTNHSRSLRVFPLPRDRDTAAGLSQRSFTVAVACHPRNAAADLPQRPRIVAPLDMQHP